MSGKLRTMEEALDLIRSGDVVAASGFGMAGMAEEVMAGLESRFLGTGRPN